MRSEKGIRLWPLGLVFAVAAIGTGLIWVAGLGQQRQDRVLYTGLIVIGTVFAAFLWLLLFSRLRWRLRVTGFLLVVILAVVAYSTVRLHAFSRHPLPRFGRGWLGCV